MIDNPDGAGRKQRSIKRFVAAVIIFLSSYVAFSAAVVDAGEHSIIIAAIAVLVGAFGVALFLFPDKFYLGGD